MVSQKFSITALAAILSTVSAHMVMNTPTPYGKSTLDNSPLLADGSDFPCKQRPGVYEIQTAQNVMEIGVPQTLSFTGSAVHGGGSCQVSLTTDLQPTKNSKWMVIKSIEGGCPASVPGNLPADPNGNGASTFQYTIPDGIAPGEYTIAWSWLNKVGNREFYMNCGPATVVGAKKKRYAPERKVEKRQASFPDMYVANLAGINSCSTPEGFDYIYPDPGADVQSAGATPSAYTKLTCGATGGATAQSPTATAAASNIPAGSAVASTAPSSAPLASGASNNGPNVSSQPSVATSFAASAPASAGTGKPGIFASGAASSAEATGAPSAVSAISTAVFSPIPATSAGSSPAPASTGSTDDTSEVAGGACTNEGAWACSADGSSFQRCAAGVWSVSMQMAQGTTCTPGMSNNLSMASTRMKRREIHARHGHFVHRDSSQ